MKMTLKRFRVSILILPVLIFGATSLLLVNCNRPLGGNGKQLEEGFLNPPQSAKPRVWWHWMNGNITKKGIRTGIAWPGADNKSGELMNCIH